MISGVCWSRNCALSIICIRCSNAFGRWRGSLRREACGRGRWMSSSQTSLPQVLRLQRSCIRGVFTSRFACHGHMCQVSARVREAKEVIGGMVTTNVLTASRSTKRTLQARVSGGLRLGKFNKYLRRWWEDVSREGECRACGPMTDVEQRFDDARSRLRDLTSSTVLQGFNGSSLGEFLPHELLVLHMVRRQKTSGEWIESEGGEREETRGTASAWKEKRQHAFAQLLSGMPKVIRWRIKAAGGAWFMSTSGENSVEKSVQKPETTRAIWNMKVREAQQCGQSPEELSFEEFQEVLRLVKPNVATGRDNVPGTILRFLSGSVQTQLYCAIVERLLGGRTLMLRVGRSSTSAWFQRKATFQSCPTGGRYLFGSYTVQSVWNVHVEGLGQRTQTSS